MLPHRLTYFEIQKYYQNDPRFNRVFSIDNLPKTIKNGAYLINLDEYADVGTHWIAWSCRKSEIVYFNSFDVEHVPAEIKEFAGNKNAEANIFQVQQNKSIMCGYFCIGFIQFMLDGGKKLRYVFSLWVWNKWQYNFKLFQRWTKLTKQTWLIK